MQVNCRLGVFLAAAGILLGPASAVQALKLESGQHILGARLGGGIDNVLTPGGGYLSVGLAYDYMLPYDLSLSTDLTYGLNPKYTDTLLWGLGARYRYQGLPIPLHPHTGLQFIAGRLFNVRGVNLSYVGARWLLGADYYLTGQLSAGFVFSLDLGGTVATPRSAPFRQGNFLVVAQYIL